jgi:uncharacterized protein YeaO (DUF488 family)
MTTPDQGQYERLLRFRTGLRRFLRWSAEQAALAGLTPAQHQLLLAVRGHPDPRGPTIGEVAVYLFLRHHSAVELIDRAQAAGLVERRADPADARAVRLGLTPSGAERLDKLASAHLEELARLEIELRALWDDPDPTGDDTQPGEVDVRMRRVYDEPSAADGMRVLVDRVWPRGLSKAEVRIDEWAKAVAPSTDLRRWYGHEPSRFEEFRRRYQAELAEPERQRALDQLRELARTGPLTLLTATRDIEHSQAAVLAERLRAED